MASPTPETAHPTLGGKSLESLQAHQAATRAPYKSWRKKYRKMRVRFDQVLEDNKRAFRDEQKLEDLARRLQEELDTMMDILLEINQDPALPTHLRYNVTERDELHERTKPTQNVVEVGIRPEEANHLMQRYREAVINGQLPHLELHFVREQIQERLAEQGVKPLSALEHGLKPGDQHGVANERARSKREQLQLEIERHLRETQPDTDASFLTAEHEDAYLARLDGKINGHEQVFNKPRDQDSQHTHQAEFTPRELERQLELLNPQSQHNWLKSHPKISAIEPDGREWVMQNEDSTVRTTGKKRASGKGSTGRNVGDRMAREGRSPSEASGMGWDDEFGVEEVHTSSGRKRAAVDKDPTFRGKISKGGSTKTKRKRTTDEGAGGGKRIRAADIFD